MSLTLIQSSSLRSVAPRLISLGTYTARVKQLSVLEALFGKQTAIFELISGRIEADGAIARGLYVVCSTGGFSLKLLAGSASALSEGRLFNNEVLGLGVDVVGGVSSFWLEPERVERVFGVLVALVGKVEVF